MESGILYIARNQYVEEAIVSAKQARSEMGDINIAIITNQELDHNIFDKIIQKNLDSDVSNKVFNLDKTPFEKTIFLDTDIYVNSDIRDIFELLDTFDIAASISQIRNEHEVSNDAFPEFNTGVIAYRDNKKISKFQDRWAEIYNRDKDEEIIADQPRFREALLSSDLKISPLPREYNCRFGHAGQLCGEVKIFHGRLIDVPSTGLSKDHAIENVVQKLNKSSLPRVFLPKSREIKLYIDRKAYHRQIIDGVREYGLREALKRGLDKFSIS